VRRLFFCGSISACYISCSTILVLDFWLQNIFQSHHPQKKLKRLLHMFWQPCMPSAACKCTYVRTPTYDPKRHKFKQRRVHRWLLDLTLHCILGILQWRNGIIESRKRIYIFSLRRLDYVGLNYEKTLSIKWAHWRLWVGIRSEIVPSWADIPPPSVWL
jgi:hypothetical protein